MVAGVLALDQPALCGHGNLGVALLRRLLRVRHSARKRFCSGAFLLFVPCCGLLWLAVDTVGGAFAAAHKRVLLWSFDDVACCGFSVVRAVN